MEYKLTSFLNFIELLKDKIFRSYSIKYYVRGTNYRVQGKIMCQRVIDIEDYVHPCISF